MKEITCQLCGKQTHSIQLHLSQEHGESSENPCTIDEYREKFPEAPLLSERAKAVLEEKRKKSAADALPSLEKTAPEPIASTKGKAPLHEVFELGRIKAARTKSGAPIMIDINESEGFEEMIPEIDPNYIFDIDVLKTCIMGLATRTPTYLFGHAGVGKSTVWEQIAARTKNRMIRAQHTGQTEEAQIVGTWTVKKTKDPETGALVAETVFELGPLAMAMKYGWIYLADEYDRGYPDVLSVYQSVLEGKALIIKEADIENRVIKPHPNFRFVATGNTNGAGDEHNLYNSTNVQDAANFERFGIVQEVTYMKPVQESAIIQSQTGIKKDDADAIVEFCNQIRKQHPMTISLSLGPRVGINIANMGVMRGDYCKGVEVAFANRLPSSEREAAMKLATRIFGFE